MIGLDWLGLTTGLTTLAFLAPLPPERPERQAPEPLRGNEWVAAVVIGSVFLMTVVPMVTIWGFHRPHDAYRVRCEASGGHVAPAALDGSIPYRCDHGGATAKAP